MQSPPSDPRYGSRLPAPGQAQSPWPNAQQGQGYGEQPQKAQTHPSGYPQGFGQQPQAPQAYAAPQGYAHPGYGQPQQAAVQQGYAAPQAQHGVQQGYSAPQGFAPAGFGQPQQQAYGGPQPQAQPSATLPSVGGVSFGMPGIPGVSGIPGLGSAGKMLSGMPQPSGLSPALAFALGAVAVVVALVFDVVFLNVHIPGIGGYAWYLTTALSFAGAGFGGAKWTRASQKTAMAAVVFAGVLYGAADIGLGLVLENLEMGGALFLGIQGLVIAFVCGGAGVRKGLAAKAD